MALLFIDSFDHYEWASQDDKWTTINRVTGAPSSIGPLVGRRDTSALIFNANATIAHASKTFCVQRQTVYAGFAIKVWRYGANVRQGFFGFMHVNNYQMDLALNGDGTIDIWRGQEQIGTFLGRTNCPLHQGCWYYLEARDTVSSNVNTGYIEIRINGLTEFTYSGDTFNTDANSERINRIVVGREDTVISDEHQFYMDDLYSLDDTGSQNNNFLGDMRVETLFVNSDGATIQWAVSTTGANYQMLDETIPNSDQDYTTTSSPGQRDTMHMTGLSVNSAYIYGVQTLVSARKDNGGDRTIRSMITTNGSTYVGSNFAINMDYQYWQQIYDTNPIQATTWTIADVNSFQVGYELVS